MLDWVRRSRDEAVRIVQLLEANSNATAYTFKCLEPMRDPADFAELTSIMGAAPRPTGQQFKHEAQKLLARRWWTWCLCHPQLTGVHSTRSVPPSPPSAPSPALPQPSSVDRIANLPPLPSGDGKPWEGVAVPAPRPPPPPSPPQGTPGRSPR